MKLSRKPSHAERGGFTLIELLIVIAIIGILISLTAAAVMRTLILGPQTTARYDISQFDSSISAFQANGGYNMDYVPSRIILRKYLDDYYTSYDRADPTTAVFKSPLDQDSVVYLAKMFNGITKRFFDNTKGQWTSNWLNGINWQTGWQTMPGKPAELLEGDQCLVFFLGGIQTTDASGAQACLGFSTNNAQPDQVGGDRKSFYEFKGSRLVARTAQGKTFFSYLDAYGRKQPYVYFSAYGKDNAYNRYYLNPKDKNYYYSYYDASLKTTVATSDCDSLGVWPYAEANQLAGQPANSSPVWRYLKPKTHQIICAGADGKFGPGSDVTLPIGSAFPVGALLYTSTTLSFLPTVAQDDQANFAANKLFAGQ